LAARSRKDSRTPDAADSVSGAYKLARPVLLILKREHVGIVPGLAEPLDESIGNAASGAHGYLTAFWG
jgi:hypothetical protein